MEGKQMKPDNSKMLDAKRVSEVYSICEGTLGQWRSLRKGPKFYKVPGGRKVLYDIKDLETFFHESPVQTSVSVKAHE